MLNKLQQFLRDYELVSPGDRVICAVSGGADSVALLFAFYLLKDKLNISLSAAHFNHKLRGEESDRDEAFVKELCCRYDIPLHCGSGQVAAGKKGLEAAARDARYGFLDSLPGKLATAHTADDNAETVLMRMVRGTGLKGLGAIAPKMGNRIRPLLSVTRQEILDFLQEYNLSYVEDSSNETDDFLRNRLRHRVMPLLKAENPRFAENVSAMALRLQADERALSDLSDPDGDILKLRAMPDALRSRALAAFLEQSGVKEPEAEHIKLLEKLVFSPKPSASAVFPGGICIGRNYDRLEKLEQVGLPEPVILECPGEAEFCGIRVICRPAQRIDTSGCYVRPTGQMVIRSREPGDTIKLSGGTKSLKKLFIDKKIPAHRRPFVPVVADEAGILCVQGIGIHQDRAVSDLPGMEILFMEKEN